MVVESKLFIHSSSGSDFGKVSVPDPNSDQGSRINFLQVQFFKLKILNKIKLKQKPIFFSRKF
jgi:hypothetical protein